LVFPPTPKKKKKKKTMETEVERILREEPDVIARGQVFWRQIPPREIAEQVWAVRFILRKYGVQRVMDAWYTKGKWSWGILCFVMPELKEAFDAWQAAPRYRLYPFGDAAFPTKRRGDMPPVRGVTIPPIPPHRSMKAFPLPSIYEKMVHDKWELKEYRKVRMCFSITTSLGLQLQQVRFIVRFFP
jgi:hypothetical protein